MFSHEKLLTLYDYLNFLYFIDKYIQAGALHKNPGPYA